jgi:NAD+ kinase
MPETDDVRVVELPEAQRYEAYVGETRAGLLNYARERDHVTLLHTEVDEAFGGHGIASALAEAAFADARDRGTPVVIACPFVSYYVERHPEVADLVV